MKDETTFKLVSPSQLPKKTKIKLHDKNQNLASSSFITTKAYVSKETETEPNYITSSNMNIHENGLSHVTNAYYLMKSSTPSLVVRRGKEFGVSAELFRPFQKTSDHFDLRITWIDPSGHHSSQVSQVEVPHGAKTRTTKDLKLWMAHVQFISKTGKKVMISIRPPDSGLVGIYQLSFITYFNKGPEHSAKILFKCPSIIYLIFNPLYENSPLFLNKPEEREEYLFMEYGTIYRGRSENNFTTHDWKHSQFQPDVLHAVFILGLTYGEIKRDDWCDPVLIARGYAKAIQSPSGLIETNFTTSFEGGRRPRDWTGSASLLNEWYKTRLPVKYGRDSTIGAVLTTIFRAIGIPARTITCYDCGFSPDESYTINFIFHEDFEIRKQLNSENGGVWDFHIWCEIWTQRRDLGNHYNGWNAVFSHLGPCPVIAVKDGNLTHKYDTKVFYGKVNSDMCFWRYYPDRPLLYVSRKSDIIGREIYTRHSKKPVIDLESSYRDKNVAVKDRKDKAAELRKSISLFNEYIESQPCDDLLFDLEEPPDVPFGEPIVLTLSLENKSKSKDFTVKIFLQLYSHLYFGQQLACIKQVEKTVKLQKGQAGVVDLEVEYQEYKQHIVDEWHLKCYASATLLDPYSEYLAYKLLQVLSPELTSMVEPSRPKTFGNLRLIISFTNPLKENLLGRFGLQELDNDENYAELPLTRVAPGQTVSGLFKMVPDQPGHYNIKGTFRGPAVSASYVVRIKVI